MSLGGGCRWPTSHGAVVTAGKARPVSLKTDAGQLDHPHCAIAMAPIGLEQLEHGVVVDPFAHQRQADHGRQVEVADRHGVRVAVHPLPDLGLGQAGGGVEQERSGVADP